MQAYYKLKLALKIATRALEKIDDETAQKALEKIADVNERAKRSFKNNRIDEGLLWCNYCKEYKPMEMFPKDRSTKTGYHHRCRECNARLSAEYKQRKKEQRQ